MQNYKLFVIPTNVLMVFYDLLISRIGRLLVLGGGRGNVAVETATHKDSGDEFALGRWYWVGWFKALGKVIAWFLGVLYVVAHKANAYER